MKIIVAVAVFFILALCLIVSRVMSEEREPVQTGRQAPRITALDEEGKAVNFPEIYQKGLVLVYFFPKADTPGCTAQACSLRDAYADLYREGLTIIGVSADDTKAQKKFKEKYNLPFTLIADSDKTVIKAFGVPLLSGLAKRQAFLIKDGIIVWYDGSASTDKQAQDVKIQLEKIKNP